MVLCVLSVLSVSSVAYVVYDVYGAHGTYDLYVLYVLHALYAVYVLHAYVRGSSFGVESTLYARTGMCRARRFRHDGGVVMVASLSPRLMRRHLVLPLAIAGILRASPRRPRFSPMLETLVVHGRMGGDMGGTRSVQVQTAVSMDIHIMEFDGVGGTGDKDVAGRGPWHVQHGRHERHGHERWRHLHQRHER